MAPGAGQAAFGEDEIAAARPFASSLVCPLRIYYVVRATQIGMTVPEASGLSIKMCPESSTQSRTEFRLATFELGEVPRTDPPALSPRMLCKDV